MLEGLQDKFVDERVTLEKEEAKKRHTYVARRFLGVETRREMKTQIGPIKCHSHQQWLNIFTVVTFGTSLSSLLVGEWSAVVG